MKVPDFKTIYGDEGITIGGGTSINSVNINSQFRFKVDTNTVLKSSVSGKAINLLDLMALLDDQTLAEIEPIVIAERKLSGVCIGCGGKKGLPTGGCFHCHSDGKEFKILTNSSNDSIEIILER